MLNYLEMEEEGFFLSGCSSNLSELKEEKKEEQEKRGKILMEASVYL